MDKPVSLEDFSNVAIDARAARDALLGQLAKIEADREAACVDAEAAHAAAVERATGTAKAAADALVKPLELARAAVVVAEEAFHAACAKTSTAVRK